ncbi:hypothetical protein EV363DRAFT_1298011 [Boletus edulis]|nr:hypothetical protein EV363DRAFT_1298011 [Boletus edulis]
MSPYNRDITSEGRVRRRPASQTYIVLVWMSRVTTHVRPYSTSNTLSFETDQASQTGGYPKLCSEPFGGPGFKIIVRASGTRRDAFEFQDARNDPVWLLMRHSSGLLLHVRQELAITLSSRRREEEAERERMDERGSGWARARSALRPGTGARLAGWGVSCEGGWERLADASARQSGSRAPDPREVSCEAPEWEWRQGVVGGCAETGEDERRGGGAKTRRAAARLRRLSEDIALWLHSCLTALALSMLVSVCSGIIKVIIVSDTIKLQHIECAYIVQNTSQQDVLLKSHRDQAISRNPPVIRPTSTR